MFDRKVDGTWQPVTAKEFDDEVKQAAAGLIASGVQPGERVCIMSSTRYEWTLLDYAIWTAGAVTVPIYETSSAEQVEWIVSDSGAVGGLPRERQPTARRTTRSSSKLAERPQRLEHRRRRGRRARHGRQRRVRGRHRAATPHAHAAAASPRSSTRRARPGGPKGCELTHRNFLFDATSTTEGLDEMFGDDQSTLLFLPLAHVFARIIQVGCVQNRRPHGSHRRHQEPAARPRRLQADVRAVGAAGVREGLQHREAARARRRQGRDLRPRRDASRSTTASHSTATRSSARAARCPHAVFDTLVYGKLRAALGGNAIGAISGGAPLGARLGHFFRGCGIPIYEGYGLTETTAGATVNRPDAMKVGTVGRPIPGCTVRIADDGEILLKGGNVFSGYYNNEKATKRGTRGRRLVPHRRHRQARRRRLPHDHRAARRS